MKCSSYSQQTTISKVKLVKINRNYKPEEYPELPETSKTKSFAKIVNSKKPKETVAKFSSLDICGIPTMLKICNFNYFWNRCLLQNTMNTAEHCRTLWTRTKLKTLNLWLFVTWHCVKSVRIQSFSGPYFPHSKKLRMWKLFTQCD